jgi:uncharacterized metal-binding protein
MNEDYAMFGPDLSLSEVKGTQKLERLYRTLHIYWPYKTYFEVRESLSHWAVATGRRKEAPKR